MNQPWPYSGESVFSLLRELAEAGHTSDFQVARYDGHDLLLIGSFDLEYYHEVEVVFGEVFYVQISTSVLSVPQLRDAAPSEVPGCQALDQASDDQFFAIVSDTHDPNPVFFIGAKSIRARRCKVYHYPRQNLLPGEEVWAPR